MFIGRILVVSGSAFGSLILTLVLTYLSSLTAIPASASLLYPTTGQVEVGNQAPASLVFPVNQDECAVSAQYPAEIYQWCGLITRYANQAGLSPDLVAAIVWQESGGDPGAYSKSGAVGLMQVMPSDGIAAKFQCINGPCFSSRPTIEELTNPEFNLQYGTQMLSRLLERTGDLRDALRSYGPMDVGYYYADKVLGIYLTYKQ